MKLSLLSILLVALFAVALATEDTEDKGNELSYERFKVMVDAEKGGKITITRGADPKEDDEDDDKDDDKDDDDEKAAMTTAAPADATTQAKEEQADRRRRSADDGAKAQMSSFSIVLASIVEVNSSGVALAADGHGFTDLDNAKVNITGKNDDTKLKTLPAKMLSFERSLGDAKLTVDVYLMTSEGNVTVDEEVLMVKKGMVKVFLKLDEKWMMCTADDCDGEVGSQMNLTFIVMAKEAGKLQTAVDNRPANMSLGKAGSVYWSNKVMAGAIDNYEDVVSKDVMGKTGGLTEVMLALPKTPFSYCLAAYPNAPPKGDVSAAGDLAASTALVLLLAALLLHRF